MKNIPPAKTIPALTRSIRTVAGLVIGLLAISWPLSAAETINLGEAQNFAVLAGTTLVNTGPTMIVGDVGVSPGSAIVGFPPGSITGSFHAADATAALAQANASAAFLQLQGQVETSNLTGQNLGGQILNPGVYRFNNSADLSGTLTLDTKGDPNAAFHFLIGSTLTTASLSSIVLLGLNGAAAQNVFWQVGSSATIGTQAQFTGTIVAWSSITLTTGVNVEYGRAIALNGAVTLDTNNIVIVPVLIDGSVWNGGTSNLWSGANWSPTVAGQSSGNLAPDADVLFSVTAGALRQDTNLDAATTISSLTVSDPVAVTISNSVLTISGAGANTGVTVNGTAGLVTINSDLVLTGAPQMMVVNNAAGLVINGAISGTLGLNKAGVGVLTLAGANNFAGATHIIQGTVQAAAANVIPQQSAVLVDRGALLNLAGFDQQIGSLEGAGAVALGAAQLSTGYNQAGTTFSGVISGPGTLQKVGAGALNLTGVNTLTGLSTVQAGTLQVTGSIAGNALVAGGTLRGTGSIGGNVVNQAAVNPGTFERPGTLRIGGNFTQLPSGSLNLRLASISDFDRILLGGSARLGGALNVSYLDGFHAQAGDSFEIISAAGGVVGRFAAFNDEHATGTLLTLGLVYEGDRVLLEFMQGSIVDALAGEHLTPNQRAVARALDRDAIAHPGNRLFEELNTLPLSQLVGALDLLSSEDFAAIFSAGLSMGLVQVGNLERRLGEVRQGAMDFSDAGFAVTDSRGAQNYDGKSAVSQDSKGGKDFVPATSREQRWGFFISGTATVGDLETTSQSRGSSFDTGGVTIGTDYRVNRQLVVGMALGYANTSADLNRGGRVDLNSGRASLYGTYYVGGFYMNAVVGGGLSSIETKRRTFGGFAQGETDAVDFNALLGTGYDFHLGALTFGPVASLQYGALGFDRFSERGAVGALRIDEQSQESLRSGLGLRASYGKKIGRVVVVPEVRAQWQHEFLTNQSAIDAGYGTGRSFTTFGPGIGRDGLLLEAGASLQLSNHVALFAYYSGDLLRENYTSHSITGGLRVSF